MNFRILSAFLLLAVFASACGGDDDAAPTYEYPITASFVDVTDVSDLMIYAKENNQIVELTADQTTADDDDFFTTYETDPSFTKIIFEEEGVATFIDDDPFFGTDTTTATFTLSSDIINFTLDFAGFEIPFAAIGNPTAFSVPSQVTNWVEEDGSNFASQGFLQESIQSLQNGIANGDTIAVLNYVQNFAE